LNFLLEVIRLLTFFIRKIDSFFSNVNIVAYVGLELEKKKNSQNCPSPKEMHLSPNRFLNLNGSILDPRIKFTIFDFPLLLL